MLLSEPPPPAAAAVAVAPTTLPRVQQKNPHTLSIRDLSTTRRIV